jgi:hypothetical protein
MTEYVSYGFQMPNALTYDWAELFVVENPRHNAQDERYVPELKPVRGEGSYIGVTIWFQEAADKFGFPLPELENSFAGSFGTQRWYYFHYSSPYKWQKLLTQFCHEYVVSLCEQGLIDEAEGLFASSFGHAIASETTQYLKKQKELTFSMKDN